MKTALSLARSRYAGNSPFGRRRFVRNRPLPANQHVCEEPGISLIIKDVAKCGGLSIATLSKSINGGNVLEKNREAIARAISETGFHVNESARTRKTSLAMGESVKRIR